MEVFSAIFVIVLVIVVITIIFFSTSYGVRVVIGAQ